LCLVLNLLTDIVDVCRNCLCAESKDSGTIVLMSHFGLSPSFQFWLSRGKAGGLSWGSKGVFVYLTPVIQDPVRLVPTIMFLGLNGSLLHQLGMGSVDPCL
jgi:hypothetical protein